MTSADDDETASITTSRRRFMQATGGVGVAGLLGVDGTASAQGTSDDNVIELKPHHTGPPDHAGPPDNAGPPDHAGPPDNAGPPDHAGPPDNAGPPDHAGPPDNAGPPDHAGHHVWIGVVPDEIEGKRNPTLSLVSGEKYTIVWTNTDGRSDNFVIEDADGNEILASEMVSEKGETQTIEFTATEEMAAYYSESHPESMRGTIEVSGDPIPEPSDDVISVLFLGGPEGGSHNAPERSEQLIPYLLNRGIEVLYTDRQADLESETLHRYDAWMLYDNRSNLTQAQEDSLVTFVENGGGFVGLHSASACFTESERFIDLLGGQFASHGAGEMTVEHAKPDHPVLSGVDPITSWDETYNHSNLNPDNVYLTYHNADGEEREPWTWVRNEGDGRVFYTAWGHDERTWSKDGFKKLVENAIRWTSGNGDTIASNTRVLDELEYYKADVPYYPSGPDDEVPEKVGEGQEWNRVQHPIPASESLKHTVTPEGFDISPYVTENMLPDGIEGNILSMDFDAQGRCWIALSLDYPNDVSAGQDKIIVCEDTDGDGQVNKFTTFAEGLSIPTSMIVVDGGVIVANLGETEDYGSMLFLKDTDGDGQADVREELFSGFDNYDTHAGPNQLDYGFDNWIWGQVGYSGFSGTVGGEQHEFSACVYRFKPDGSKLEVIAELPGNQAGLGFNEQGLAFASAATAGQPSNYVSIPQRYYELVNGFSVPTLGSIADTNRFLPITQRVRQVDWHGGFTAATSHTMYTAREFPEKYWNRTGFVGDGTGHLFSAFYVEPDGAGFSSHYPHNIVASKDGWFSPSYSRVGPDGMLWFIDLYNYIYQHNPTPEGFETGDGNAYVTDLRDYQYSRLYRITYGDDTNSRQDLSDAGPSELVGELTDDNMFWRRTAQRLLVERGKQDIVSGLIDLIDDQSVDEVGLNQGAIHALWTLHGLGLLDKGSTDDASLQAARGALTHPSGGVRLNAVRVLPGSQATRATILNKDLLNDDNPRVQMWALLKLAETPADNQAGKAVYDMISREANYGDDLLVDAATSAGAQHANGFITAYEANEDTGDGPPDDRPNLLTNPSFETGANGSPEGWVTNTWGGSAEFSYASSSTRTGENSVSISSTEGADASWTQVLDVEPGAEYTVTAYVKTGANFAPTTGFGVTLNVHELGQDSLANVVTESGTDWTKLETTITAGNNEQLTFNLLYGGWGFSTGTVWFDDAEVVQTGGFGGGLQTVYDRVKEHVELEDGGGDDGGGDDDGETIAPNTTIEMDALVEGWEATAPSAIDSETNPILSLEAGGEYTVEWTNADGLPHDFVIQDSEKNEITGTEIVLEQGVTTSLTFTASSEMAQYICTVHPSTMVADIEVI